MGSGSEGIVCWVSPVWREGSNRLSAVGEAAAVFSSGNNMSVSQSVSLLDVVAFFGRKLRNKSLKIYCDGVCMPCGKCLKFLFGKLSFNSCEVGFVWRSVWPR
jgi:hypothetical protein